MTFLENSFPSKSRDDEDHGIILRLKDHKNYTHGYHPFQLKRQEKEIKFEIKMKKKVDAKIENDINHDIMYRK